MTETARRSKVAAVSAAPGLQGDASSGPPNGAREGERGLTRAEAEAALARHGRNEIERQQTTPRWRMFVAQFASALVLILLAAAVVSAIVGAWDDAVAITVIVLVNGVIGFVQESRGFYRSGADNDVAEADVEILLDGFQRADTTAELYRNLAIDGFEDSLDRVEVLRLAGKRAIQVNQV